MDDAYAAARAAGLRYANDDEAGIVRQRRGRGFRYFDAAGYAVRDPQTLRRIKSLAIPPAWSDVWICASPRGHVQATGRDRRRRKQYRYHPLWRAVRDHAKYSRTAEFARALPALRRRVTRDLALPGLPRRKVVALVVRLLESTLLRVGNEEYARANRSFGLTTLRNRHVDVRGAEVRFSFRGKSGRQIDVGMRDRRVARLIRRCEELPGQRLFQYVDADGNIAPIDSDDVNGYLRSAMGDDFSAKDFRTWAGTVGLVAALRSDGEGAAIPTPPTQARVLRAIGEVARSLGNTTAVCRRSYIHPSVIDAYFDGTVAVLAPSPAGRRGLRADERLVLSILDEAGRRQREKAAGDAAA